MNFNDPLPLPYIHEVCNYKNAKVKNIQESVSDIHWNFIFQGKTLIKKLIF